LRHNFDRNTYDTLSTHLRSVESSFAALQVLSSAKFNDEREAEIEKSPLLKVKKKSQWASKRARRAGVPVPLDCRSFQDLGHTTPTTAEDAEEITRKIITDQKRVLEVRQLSCFSSRVLTFST